MKKIIITFICIFSFSIASAASIVPILPNSIVGPLMKEAAIISMPSDSIGSSLNISSSGIPSLVGSVLYPIFSFLTNAGTIVTSAIPSIP